MRESRTYGSVRGALSNGRPYRNPKRLVTRVDAASDPTRIGSDQVRGVRFEGERMVLIPPPRLTGESEEHREITWERIAAE